MRKRVPADNDPATTELFDGAPAVALANPVANDDRCEDEDYQDEPSEVAKAVATLKKSALEASVKRERLPQPLFWSLFSEQIREIKRQKARARLLTSVFD